MNWAEQAQVDDEHRMDLAERDKRIAELETGLRVVRAALWELHAWPNREVFERDPAVILIDRLLTPAK